ncbi:MAG: 50S ribosomal protein L36 [Candidatus Gracilibacteria bacterium]|nr:50S ribosomal protein L36 [Candidatus Gracilibacteria bacterium]
MKNRASVKTICEHCFLIIRRSKGGNKGTMKPRRRIGCSRNPRHKQVQG